MLSILWVRYPDELIADVYRVYGVDARTLFENDIELLSILVSQLPKENSRVWGAYDIDLTWSMVEVQLNSIEYHLRALLYGLSNGKKHGMKIPTPILPYNKKPSAESDGVTSTLNNYLQNDLLEVSFEEAEAYMNYQLEGEEWPTAETTLS